VTHKSTEQADGLTKILAEIDHHYADLCSLQAWEYAIKSGLIAAKLAAEHNPSDAVRRYHDLIAQSKASGLPNLAQQALIGLAEHQPAALAKKTLRQAADIFVDLRRKMPVEVLKATLLSGHAHLYTRLIEAELGCNTAVDAARTLLEAKGAIWTDLMASIHFEKPDPAWIEARMALSQWQEQFLWATEPAHKAFCEGKVTEAENRFSEINHRQARNRTLLPLPSLDQIQAQLSADQAILDYFVGSQDIWVCITTVQEAGHWVNLGPVQPIKEFMERLSILLVKLIPQSGENPESQRREEAIAQQGLIDPILSALYDRLIRPIGAIIQSAHSLLIAPDQFLFALPWAALYDSQKYLGEAYLIHTIPTPVILVQEDQSDDGLKTQLPSRNTVATLCENVLILGNPGNPPLTYMDAELDSIHGLFPHGQVINPASSQAFQWETPPTLLHISCYSSCSLQIKIIFWPTCSI